jgi:hypothetical protein
VYNSSDYSVSELTNNYISYLRMLGYCKIRRYGSRSRASFMLVDVKRRSVAALLM